MIVDQSPFEWASQHLHLVGWPVLVVLSWKISRFLTNIEARFKQSEEHIHTMASNEFPHMQQALEHIDQNIGRLIDDYFRRRDTD